MNARDFQKIRWHAIKPINRTFGKAIHRYGLISEGDRIAVGISGGIDSLMLMFMLNERQHRIPISYSISGIHINPGFDRQTSDQLMTYCAQQGYNLTVDYTEHGLIAHSDQNRENPCFLCARLRRKRLFEIADQLNCNKLALGHNKDDLIETLFINMCYGGEMSTMLPKQSMFKNKFHIIRPLALTDADIIRRVSKKLNFPIIDQFCPSAGKTKRHEIRQMLMDLYQKNHKIKGNLFRALSNVRSDYLLSSFSDSNRQSEMPNPTGLRIHERRTKRN